MQTGQIGAPAQGRGLDRPASYTSSDPAVEDPVDGTAPSQALDPALCRPAAMVGPAPGGGTTGPITLVGPGVPAEETSLDAITSSEAHVRTRDTGLRDMGFGYVGGRNPRYNGLLLGLLSPRCGTGLLRFFIQPDQGGTPPEELPQQEAFTYRSFNPAAGAGTAGGYGSGLQPVTHSGR